MENNTSLISSAELSTTEFLPFRWPILDLLPEGLAVLAGPRGVGKSSLALNLAMAVSRGTPLFGSIPVEQGPCLVVSLEETKRRLRSRLSAVLNGSGAPAPENLHLCTEMPSSLHASCTLLVKWMLSHPKVKLVVVDPLRRFLGRQKGPHLFVRFAELTLDLFSQIARDRHLTILCIHHSRILSASGTFQALPQRLRFLEHADTFLVLRPGGNESVRILSATGRDFPERRLVLEEGAQFGEWRMAESTTDEEDERRPLKKEVVQLLEKEAPLTPKQIAETLEKNRNTIRTILAQLLAKGTLRRTENGEYALAEQES